MALTWLRALFRGRIFNILAATFCLGSFIRGWRVEEWTWLGIRLLLGIGALLEVFWPEATTRPKAIKISVGAMLVVVIALVARGGWQWEDKSAAFLIPTTFTVTPAKAFQGQTLEVNISATDATFTESSLANLGPGVTILTNRMLNPTTLLARIEIVSGAIGGYRRVWVATPGARTAIDNSPAGAFQVLAAPVMNK